MLDLFSGIYKNKKVLITGDTGFKGSWLCIWLAELGADVYGYSLPPWTLRDNFVTSGLENKIHHTDGDIRDKEKLQNYFNHVQPDIAFHLAAQPLVIESYNNPHYSFETNVMGTVNFFEAVRNCASINAAVNITTDKCYQNNKWIWGYRENDPLGGIDPYSASKSCAELITNSYLESFFKNDSTPHIASARAGNIVGGGDWAKNRIIPDALRAYESNSSLVIRNPDSIRPWQFVLEPLCGYLKLGEGLLAEGKKFAGAWNFGPSAFEEYSVKNIITEVKKVLPALKVDFVGTTSGLHEEKILKLDISKALNCLSWKPKLSFQKTVEYTINGYLEGMNREIDCYQSRVKQIKEYCAL